MQIKTKIIGIVSILVIVFSVFIFFRYFFTFEQRNVFQRKLETITGQNLTVTVFGFDGKIIKRWIGVQKITTGRSKDGSGERNYTYFFTKDDKYVQIPDSVWYIAEEE